MKATRRKPGHTMNTMLKCLAVAAFAFSSVFCCVHHGHSFHAYNGSGAYGPPLFSALLTGPVSCLRSSMVLLSLRSALRSMGRECGLVVEPAYGSRVYSIQKLHILSCSLVKK